MWVLCFCENVVIKLEKVSFKIFGEILTFCQEPLQFSL